MPGDAPITIIGGGLAGLALGIGLRQHQVPVTVHEAGSYPRHRVCGEFINGKGLRVLEKLALRSRLEQAGAIIATTVQFRSQNASSPVRQIPPAFCLSRYRMDHILAETFQQLGGTLLTGQRVPRSLAGGEVQASGRRASPTAAGWRWFGIKAHARGIHLDADLEMHLSTRGYIGVNRIDADLVNVCGLFRVRPGESPSGARLDLLRQMAGASLRAKLEHAQFDEQSWCSVAGLCFQSHARPADEQLCLGDAMTMIPPVTGNGMSMAFESAEIAIAPLTAYSRGQCSWTEARRTIQRQCEAAFVTRLRWAALLQALMFAPLVHSRLGAFLFKSDFLWNTMLSRTR